MRTYNKKNKKQLVKKRKRRKQGNQTLTLPRSCSNFLLRYAEDVPFRLSMSPCEMTFVSLLIARLELYRREFVGTLFSFSSCPAGLYRGRSPTSPSEAGAPPLEIEDNNNRAGLWGQVGLRGQIPSLLVLSQLEGGQILASSLEQPADLHWI